MEVQKDKARQPNAFVTFLWICAGVTPSILRELPTEWNKYAAIGASVLTTGIMAGVSGGYASFIVFQSVVWAVLFGCFWGLLIFNLDRYIVLSLTGVDGDKPYLAAFTEQLLKALPRIIMAVLIGITISAPIRIAIFQNEIQQQIYLEQHASIDEVQQKIAVKEAEISGLSKNLDFESNRLKELSDAYIAEVTGKGGTGKVGAGPMYYQRLSEYKKAEAEFRARKDEVESELLQKTEELAVLKSQEKDLNQAQQSAQSSLASKLRALSALAGSDRRIALEGYLITILIILLEASPLLVMLMASRGPYEDMLRITSQAASARATLSETFIKKTQEAVIDAEVRKALEQALDKSSLNPTHEKLRS